MADPVVVRLTELAVARFGAKARALGPEDDLFESLGIDSLQALDLLTDLEAAVKVDSAAPAVAASPRASAARSKARSPRRRSRSWPPDCSISVSSRWR